MDTIISLKEIGINKVAFSYIRNLDCVLDLCEIPKALEVAVLYKSLYILETLQNEYHKEHANYAYEYNIPDFILQGLWIENNRYFFPTETSISFKQLGYFHLVNDIARVYMDLLPRLQSDDERMALSVEFKKIIAAVDRRHGHALRSYFRSRIDLYTEHWERRVLCF